MPDLIKSILMHCRPLERYCLAIVMIKGFVRWPERVIGFYFLLLHLHCCYLRCLKKKMKMFFVTFDSSVFIYFFLDIKFI